MAEVVMRRRSVDGPGEQSTSSVNPRNDRQAAGLI